MLLAYNEAVEISEKLTELPEIPDHEVRQSILFHMVNVFYSKYIAPGGTMHVRVTQGTLGDFIHRLANYSGIEQEVRYSFFYCITSLPLVRFILFLPINLI